MINNEVSFTKINDSEFELVIFHENHVSCIPNTETIYSFSFPIILNFTIPISVGFYALRDYLPLFSLTLAVSGLGQ
jgi:hypothetical protein